MFFADDIVVVRDSKEEVNEKLEKGRQALETWISYQLKQNGVYGLQLKRKGSWF